MPSPSILKDVGSNNLEVATHSKICSLSEKPWTHESWERPRKERIKGNEDDSSKGGFGGSRSWQEEMSYYNANDREICQEPSALSFQGQVRDFEQAGPGSFLIEDNI